MIQTPSLLCHPDRSARSAFPPLLLRSQKNLLCSASDRTRPAGLASHTARHDPNEHQQEDYGQDTQPPWPMRCRLRLGRQCVDQRNGGRARWNISREGGRIYSRCRQRRGTHDVTRLQAHASLFSLGDAHAQDQQQQSSVFEVWAHHSGKLYQEFQPKVESGSNSVSMTKSLCWIVKCKHNGIRWFVSGHVFTGAERLAASTFEKGTPSRVAEKVLGAALKGHTFRCAVISSL